MQCLQAANAVLQQHGRTPATAARRRSVLRLRRCVAAAQSEPQTSPSQAADDHGAPAELAAAGGPAAAPAAQPAAAAPPQPQQPPRQQGYGTGYRRMSLQSFLSIDDGPPRVMSLLDPHILPAPGSETRVTDRRQHLPLMLYLPGVDGSGLAASRQFPSLLQRFDLRTLVTPPSVRGCCQAGVVPCNTSLIAAGPVLCGLLCHCHLKQLFAPHSPPVGPHPLPRCGGHCG